MGKGLINKINNIAFAYELSLLLHAFATCPYYYYLSSPLE